MVENEQNLRQEGINNGDDDAILQHIELNPPPPPRRKGNDRVFLVSIASISLGTFIVAVSSPLALPLFPTRRISNDSQSYVQIIINTLGIIFICNISQPLASWKQALRCLSFYILRKRDGPPNPFANFNYLAKCFFTLYFLAHAWRIANDVNFLRGKFEECVRWLLLAVNLTQLILAFLVFTAIVAESKDKQQDHEATTGTELMQWAFVGAACLSTAFSYFVEEATWGYLEILELSLKHPAYGFNLTNCSTVSECVDPLFQAKSKCLHLEISPGLSHFSLYGIPITAEYFALATFFCVIKWQQVGEERTKRGLPCNQVQGQVEEAADAGSPAVQYHICTEKCFFSFTPLATGLLVTLLILLTLLELFIFPEVMHVENTAGVWIFVIHLVFGHFILLVSELIYYYSHLVGMKAETRPPDNERLNIILLVFPLLPIGILYTLQVFPRLALISTSSLLDKWTTIYVLKAVLQLVQVGFQAMFISEIFCTSDAKAYRASRYFFIALAALNLWIWFGWTWMCEKITIMGNSSQGYGEVTWTIIVYSTVPFALFCYAHAAACFFEIFAEVRHHHDDPLTNEHEEGGDNANNKDGNDDDGEDDPSDVDDERQAEKILLVTQHKKRDDRAAAFYKSV